MNEESIKIPRQPSKWLCHKLQCCADFMNTFTENNNDCYYLDIFAGSGIYPCKIINSAIEGTEIAALKSKFKRCIFIVSNPMEAELLRQSTIKYKDRSYIITGNCINDIIMQQAFDLIPRSKSAFALVDPIGYTGLRWTTIKKLASHGQDWRGHKIDMMIILPLEMALLRNLTREDCETSINRLFGNTEWQRIRQDRLDGKIDHYQAGQELIDLFKKGLKGLQYRYIEDLQPARFSNPPNYHIIWASDNASRKAELDDIWNRARFLPCELFGEFPKE